MPETIESFVEKLQKDGVDAGRQEAEIIVERAKKDAEKIVSDAQQEAESLVAEAKKQADNSLKHGKEELALAARDALRRLRETLVAAVEGALKQAVSDKLSDTDFLDGLIRDVVGQYASKDAAGERHIEIKLGDNALKALNGRGLRDAIDGGSLSGGLKAAGFVYALDGSRVEVTAESVAETLAEVSSPRLRDIIDQAASQAGDGGGKG